MSGHTHLIIDGHVHLYDCFDVQVLLEASYENLSRAAARFCAEGERVLPVLVFTSTAWEPGFARLRESVAPEIAAPSTRWHVIGTDEETSVLLRRGDRLMAGIQGAQVITSESLEVLLVGIADRPPDGLPAREVVETALASGAICVLPWSPGKWWFRRGRLVTQLIDTFAGRGLRVGDTAQRPALWRSVGHFEHAASLGAGVLPGTDPLPFPAEARRAGSLGMITRADVDTRTPTRTLLEALARAATKGRVVGTRVSVSGFVVSQVRMQLRRLI